MSMPLSIEPPPAAPVAVPYLPDASMDVSIFSTDCAVSAVQPSHALLKTPLEILWGSQSVNTSAEKSVSALQLYQAAFKNSHLGSLVLKLVNAGFEGHVSWQLVTSGISSRSKLVNELQPRKALTKVVAVGNGVLNEVSPLDCHALVKFTLLALVPSFAPAGNDVRAEQFCQVDKKFEQFFRSVVLKSESEVQRSHEAVALVAEGN